MEENKIETPLSEVDSNVTTEVVNETESNEQTTEVNQSSELDAEDVVEAFENDPDVQKLKADEEELIRLMSNPDVMRAYKDAKRVAGRYTQNGDRRKVSKKENKKKKAKRRMAKKSKR